MEGFTPNLFTTAFVSLIGPALDSRRPYFPNRELGGVGTSDRFGLILVVPPQDYLEAS